MASAASDSTTDETSASGASLLVPVAEGAVVGALETKFEFSGTVEATPLEVAGKVPLEKFQEV